ncbi:MAG: hypothetical protein GY953_47260, partial [bacterium]|nr:hypothetical protein [bacterium]
AEVYFRLGRSWNAIAAPPADFDKWAEIAKHVVMHYNEGWAGGHHFNVRYWEVWNEPNIQRFWTGTPEQFFELYETTVRVLKAHDPKLKVGTCGLAGAGRESAYREGLIRYCARNKAPLDFYSWHHYHLATYDPYDMIRIAKVVRQLLDDNGFAGAESHLTEWNLDLGRSGPENQNSMAAGAFTASVLAYLQDAPVDLAHYYRGDAGHPMGLFHCDGAFKKKAYAYLAMARMLDTPRRLAATGADTIGFAVLAGRSDDGRKVQVLISNYERIPPTRRRPPRKPGPRDLLPRPADVFDYRDNDGYELTVENLPWGDAPFDVQRYRVSEERDFELVGESAERGATFRLAEPLPPPGIELVVLQAREGPR